MHRMSTPKNKENNLKGKDQIIDRDSIKLEIIDQKKTKIPQKNIYHDEF